MYRLYYWIHGAPENRTGGPWWYKDFNTKDKRLRFFNNVVELLHDYEFVDDNLINHGPFDIKPPRKNNDK